MARQRFTFSNTEGHALSALLEVPEHGTHTYALFAHCFTCSKDIAAASRISRALVARGIGVLRFDFTGLGNSEGDFANTNFSSNVEDLVAAAHHLTETFDGPRLLIGHSLGGAAVLAAAHRIESATAVVTIGAPATPTHVTHHLAESLDVIEQKGSAEVTLAGRKFTIKKQFLEDLDAHRMEDRIRHLKKALLIFHAPQDDTVPVDEAKKIYVAAVHPKSFISLDGADHLLTRKQDSEYVADTITAWASRYLPSVSAQTSMTTTPPGEVHVETLSGKFAQTIIAGRHAFIGDEPVDFGGGDAGPNPYDLLLAALGTCTSMTLQMYANHKKWNLKHVQVDLKHERMHAKDCEECPDTEGKVERITRTLKVEGDLSEAQRARLLEIADRCPVHRTLHAGPTVVTRWHDEP